MTARAREVVLSLVGASPFWRSWAASRLTVMRRVKRQLCSDGFPVRALRPVPLAGFRRLRLLSELHCEQTEVSGQRIVIAYAFGADSAGLRSMK
jgi:hypothetical protein